MDILLYTNIKIMSSVFLFLNTKDSYNKLEPSNATWPVNMSFQNYQKQFLSVENMSFMNSVYPINNNNNTLVYEENAASSTTTSTLTNNSYTGAQLASHLQTTMNADTQEGTTYTVSYDSQTRKLTFSGTQDFKILSTSTCLRQIGIASAGMSAAATSKVADYIVRLDSTEYVDVITNLSTRNVNTNLQNNTLARVYITAPFGSLQTYSNQTNDNMLFFSEELNSLDIRLIDDQGNTFSLDENSPVDYTLKFTFSGDG